MKSLILVLATAACLSACESGSGAPTPAQARQAETDCAPHGGLVQSQYVYVLLRQNRVDSLCKNGVLIQRKTSEHPKSLRATQ